MLISMRIVLVVLAVLVRLVLLRLLLCLMRCIGSVVLRLFVVCCLWSRVLCRCCSVCGYGWWILVFRRLMLVVRISRDWAMLRVCLLVLLVRWLMWLVRLVLT